jgi:hypothetical protein
MQSITIGFLCILALIIIGLIVWYLDKLFQMVVEWVKRKR